MLSKIKELLHQDTETCVAYEYSSDYMINKNRISREGAINYFLTRQAGYFIDDQLPLECPETYTLDNDTWNLEEGCFRYSVEFSLSKDEINKLRATLKGMPTSNDILSLGIFAIKNPERYELRRQIDQKLSDALLNAKVDKKQGSAWVNVSLQEFPRPEPKLLSLCSIQ